MIISEHHDESLIVMRRKLCWEISDIMYLPLRVVNYEYKQSPLNASLGEKLRNWSMVDLMLHKTFNETLWIQISRYGQDFWKELEFFNIQKKRIFEFCNPIITLAKAEASKVRNTLELNEYIVIPESPWGSEYKIDYVWCLMSKIDLVVFRNIIRVKEYPKLCNHLYRKFKHIPLTTFRKYRNSSKVRLNPMFCSQNRTSPNSTFQVPYSVLLRSTIYTPKYP